MSGFKTGIDLYTAEEQAKRKARAARFDVVSDIDASYRPLVDEDATKKKERAERFGTAYNARDHSGLQEQDLLEERKDHGAAIERRPDTIHLYGVDRMSTRECLQYFEGYGPSSVEWLDDSSCNVVFGDADSAKRAVVSLGRPFAPGEAPDLQGLDLHDMANLPYMWHKGQDFKRPQKGAKPAAIPLIFRMATVEDRKGVAPTKRSRYLWLQNGRQNGSSKYEDGDFNVTSGKRGRKERGGKKAKQRKKRRTPNGAEIEMEDAEDFYEDTPALLVSTTASQETEPGAPDLRESLNATQAGNLPSGQSRLFSATDAGMAPYQAASAAEDPDLETTDA